MARRKLSEKQILEYLRSPSPDFDDFYASSSEPSSQVDFMSSCSASEGQKEKTDLVYANLEPVPPTFGTTSANDPQTLHGGKISGQGLESEANSGSTVHKTAIRQDEEKTCQPLKNSYSTFASDSLVATVCEEMGLGSHAASLDDSDEGGDNEENESSSENETNVSCDSSIINDNIVGSENPRKRHNKEQWQIVKRKRNKASGNNYISVSGKEVSKKEMSSNPCKGRKCRLHCGGNWSEVERLHLFKTYWNLGDLERQKQFIAANARNESRKVPEKETKKQRTVVRKYFLPKEGVLTEVCKLFFCATLGIGKRLVEYTLDNLSDANVPQRDRRGGSRNFLSDGSKEAVLSWIKELPAVPSHYIRRDSAKKYLPSEFRNRRFTYRLYKDAMTKQGVPTVCENTFKNIWFKNFNIGFHHPKKDKCMFCEKKKNTECETDEQIAEYELHIREKEATQQEHLRDQKKRLDDSEFLCGSFDLQKVLNTPHSKSVLLYYTRKYAYYNFTVYESVTKYSRCYLWGESDGKRGAIEIATCLSKWIKDIDARGTIKDVVLYCDCCGGQNRNRTVLAMLYTVLQECKTINTLELKYLLPGHTYMPCDSVHSAIESNLKGRTVYGPSEWKTIIRMSRRDNPYDVYTMSYDMFQDWTSVANKILPSTGGGREKVKWNKLRQVKFVRGITKIAYKTSFLEDADVEVFDFSTISSKPKRKTRSTRNRLPASAEPSEVLIPKPNQAYFRQFPISEPKYKDLKKLCDQLAIPAAFHHEYLNLIHNGTVEDVLNETDEDDDDTA